MGQPVEVGQGFEPEKVQGGAVPGEVRREEVKPCNGLCIPGWIIIVMGVVFLGITWADFLLATAEHAGPLRLLRFLRIVPLISVFVGLGVVSKCVPTPVPHGCDCCVPTPCCPCLPWTLLAFCGLGWLEFFNQVYVLADVGEDFDNDQGMLIVAVIIFIVQVVYLIALGIWSAMWLMRYKKDTQKLCC